MSARLRDPRARNVAGFAGISYATVAIATLGSVAAARALGPAQRGTLAALIVSQIFIELALSGGVLASLKRDMARNAMSLADAMATSRRLSQLAFPLAAALSAIAVQLIAGSEGLLTKVAAFVLLLSSTFTVFSSTYLQAMVATAQVHKVALGRMVPATVSSVGLGILAALDRLSLAAALIVSFVSFLPLMLFAVSDPASRRGHSVALRPHLRFGLRALPGQLTELGAVRLDQLLLIGLVSRADLGVYAICVTVSGLGIFAAQGLVHAQFRSLANTTRRTGRDGVRAIAWPMAIGGFVSALIALVFVPLFPIVFGDAYGQPTGVLVLLTLGNVPLVGLYASSSLLISWKEPTRATVGWLAAVGAQVVVLPVVAPSHGAAGAAGASLGSYLFGLIVNIALIATANGHDVTPIETVSTS